MNNKIDLVLHESLDLKKIFFLSEKNNILQAAHLIAASVRNGGKLLIYGNGGSAADAQHLAAEFLHRLDSSRLPRPRIPAIALTTDSSTLTAIGNDASFDSVFSSQLSVLGKSGDVAIGISTSGNSKNVIEATKVAKENGLKTIGLLGGDGGILSQIADVPIVVRHNYTPRVQEVHIMVEHLLCELVEDELYFS